MSKFITTVIVNICVIKCFENSVIFSNPFTKSKKRMRLTFLALFCSQILYQHVDCSVSEKMFDKLANVDFASWNSTPLTLITSAR